jgi:hypothetical protein
MGNTYIGQTEIKGAQSNGNMEFSLFLESEDQAPCNCHPGEFCKHDTAVGGLQIFGTAVVAIVNVTFKSSEFCKFGIAVG